MITAPTQTTIHDGFYTIVTGNTHRTFRIRTNDADSSFAPGRQVIGYLHGPSNEGDYINFAFVGDGRIFPWKRFSTGYDHIIAAARYLVAGNHEQAGRQYAMQSGNCYRCGRLLTTPESIELGIGPTCRNK